MTSTHSAEQTPLRDLVAALGPTARLLPSGGGAGEVGVTDVTHDSREAGPGVVFAARPGLRSDGHDHAPAAAAAGAPALIVQRILDVQTPQVLVESVADALGPAAAAVHRHPSSELALLGITGTNGKTTTAYLLESVLQAAGHTVGLIGTVETRIAGARIPGLRTTPEATDLQRLLRRMRTQGVTAGAMEVSSHGLALGRVRATTFAAALFTNLTQDHLDFHRDMDDYYAAKRSLFDRSYTGIGVVNIDDPYGSRLAAQVDIDIVRVSVGSAPGADVRAAGIRADAAGSTFDAVLPSGTVSVRTRLPGTFNVANALLAVAAAEAIGIDAAAAAAGIEACAGVPGRMERVDGERPFTVLVDYAHTPDSLANVLRTLRDVSDGRIFVVVGCGGDRDAGKRPLMGKVAAQLADHAVFTNDNPRSEDPRAILDAMVAGAADVADSSFITEPDRRAAIALALERARPGDVVLIAGKGHEATQEFADHTEMFDDRQVARELLAGAA